MDMVAGPSVRDEMWALIEAEQRQHGWRSLALESWGRGGQEEAARGAAAVGG